ncbi:PAN/Apple domain-containing protein, partial [Tabrizicola sp.]|uniref:PAN/Apple domain-containing protein n=1 Tax=Tabrizicola sp. TaxID=2005166 RepID=UPI00286AEB2F
MRKFAAMVLSAVLLVVPGLGAAQDLIPEKRVVVTQDQDLPGGDVASVFDTTIDACERACTTNARCTAFTFNTRNGSCFVKNNPGEGAFFQGAYSAFVIGADAAIQAAAADRRKELSFLPDWDLQAAYDEAAGLGRQHTTGPWTAEEHLQAAADAEARGDWVMAAAFTGAELNLTDDAASWLEFARRQLEAGKTTVTDSGFYLGQSFPSAINAYLRADNPALRHSILVLMGDALERNGRGRDTVQALRLAQSL